jgi:hypothetical protein
MVNGSTRLVEFVGLIAMDQRRKGNDEISDPLVETLLDQLISARTFRHSVQCELREYVAAGGNDPKMLRAFKQDYELTDFEIKSIEASLEKLSA